MHKPAYSGGPCERCGLAYSPKTVYIPCLNRGETFEQWAARQSEETLALSRDPRAKKLVEERTRGA